MLFRGRTVALVFDVSALVSRSANAARENRRHPQRAGARGGAGTRSVMTCSRFAKQTLGWNIFVCPGVAKGHNASLSLSKMVSAEVASYGAVGSDRRREARDAFNIRAVVSAFVHAGACTFRRLPGLVGACNLAFCSLGPSFDVAAGGP